MQRVDNLFRLGPRLRGDDEHYFINVVLASPPMTQQKSFIQKIIYLIIIGVLLVPLYLLGRPAKIEVKTGQSVLDRGGKLAQLRDEEGLTESNIGEIDPASSTVKLATFGLRGVAIALLWHRSQEYEKKKDWSNVIATSNQLTLLEPHFTTIWEFLGWKLSYNASAEFDDYRERYRWVIRGFDFLTKGVDYNLLAPKLCKATGWTISQKIGIADENQQYRRLLREDDAFGLRHDCKLPSERDNWMLGRRWYAMGENLVKRGISIGKESDFLFFSHARLNLFNFATWIRKDGCGLAGSGSAPIFGAQAVAAWQNAGREWVEFAKMDLSTAIPKDGSMNMAPGVEAHRTTLQTADTIHDDEKKLLDELKGLVPGLYEKLFVDRWKKLAETPGEQGVLLDNLRNAEKGEDEEYKILRPWLDKNEPDWQKRLQADVDKLYPKEVVELTKIPSLLLEESQRDIINKTEGEVGQIRTRAMEMLKVGPKVLMQEIQESDVPREKKQRARNIVQEIDGFATGLRMSNLYRDILNYKFRIREVQVEETHEADEARRLRHIGRVAYYDGRLKDSIRLWIEAMAAWDKLFNKPGFEDVAKDAQFIREIIDIVEKFVILLDNDNSIFPDNIPMQGMIWAKVNQENNPQPAIEALEYAKKEFDRGEFEAAEKHVGAVLFRFDGINRSIEFMKLAPLHDLRDKMLEAFALYVECVRKRNGQLLSQPPAPLKDFAELMLKHDPLLDQAVAAIQPGIPLLREKKGAEAQAEFDKALEIWKKLLTKYPVIYLDRQLPAFSDASVFGAAYAESLKLQEKPIPDDFLLKPFLVR